MFRVKEGGGNKFTVSFSAEETSPSLRCITSPVAQRWRISVPVADSDSEARALHDHRDAGLHGTVTNICQLPRATGKKAAKWVFT